MTKSMLSEPPPLPGCVCHGQLVSLNDRKFSALSQRRRKTKHMSDRADTKQPNAYKDFQGLRRGCDVVNSVSEVKCSRPPKIRENMSQVNSVLTNDTTGVGFSAHTCECCIQIRPPHPTRPKRTPDSDCFTQSSRKLPFSSTMCRVATFVTFQFCLQAFSPSLTKTRKQRRDRINNRKPQHSFMQVLF